ncbi:hypothetical protein ACA373_21640 [Erwinia sp. STN24]|uniref:FitA-like ribbon-helix-helix domain-containing protein n=1 Tax=Erwinia sp. STN24 TaxID=3233996 RepID=UPI0035204BD6
MCGFNRTGFPRLKIYENIIPATKYENLISGFPAGIAFRVPLVQSYELILNQKEVIMAKLQVRNFPDEIYAYIERAAAEGERSIEGELRHTLRRVYTPQPAEAPQLSQLAQWQHDTGARLSWFIAQLKQDGYFKRGEPADAMHVARLACESSPAYLLRCLDGDEALSFDLADRLARRFDGNAHWLMSGNGQPFPCPNLGSRNWKHFFSDATPEDTFHLIRLSMPRTSGTLLCIRHCATDNSYRAGAVLEQFTLSTGMGSGGSGNLFRFMEYLKMNGRSVRTVGHELKLSEDIEYGNHHPLFYLRHTRISDSQWLFNMMTGERPGSWLTDFNSYLNKLAAVPFEAYAPAPQAQEAEHG